MHLRLRIERIWMLASTEYYQRYYGSTLGVLWALLNPLFRILIYYLAFTFLIFRDRTPDFILYLFLGITIWQYFSENTNKGVNLLKSKKYLVQNVGMKKTDIFIASSLSTSISFFLNIVIYFIIALWFDVHYSWTLLLLPLLFLNLLFLVIGIAMILSTLHLFIRDLKHIWDIALLLGFWTIPIIWDAKYVYDPYTFMLYGNPITGILINIRNILLYDANIDAQVFFLDWLYAICFILIGTWAVNRYSYKLVERL